jgi:hypothetical protein
MNNSGTQFPCLCSLDAAINRWNDQAWRLSRWRVASGVELDLKLERFPGKHFSAGLWAPVPNNRSSNPLSTWQFAEPPS